MSRTWDPPSPKVASHKVKGKLRKVLLQKSFLQKSFFNKSHPIYPSLPAHPPTDQKRVFTFLNKRNTSIILHLKVFWKLWKSTYLYLFCLATTSFDVSSFPFSFFYYLLLKCKTILKTSFELNCTGTTLLYQSPEAEGGGVGIYLWIKRASFKFLNSWTCSKIDFLKKDGELNGSWK